MWDIFLKLISSGPVTLLVVAAILVVLHKAGVLQTIFAFVSKKPEIASPDTIAEVRGALQPLMTQMESLTQYANHDTTKHLEDHTELLKQICGNLDRLVLTHENYEKIGIKTRSCTNHK